MGFRNFRLNVAARLVLLGGLIFTVAWSMSNTDWRATPLVCGVLAALMMIELARYVESINRELAGFLAFVSHRDFSVSFPIREKGSVFRDLEFAYDILTKEYRDLNLEKAANHQYLESLIEHVSIALICLDDAGDVKLMNRQAKELFKTQHLNSLKSFRKIDEQFPVLIDDLADGGRALINVKIADERLQLALYATEFSLLGQRYKLISFQNIRDELEQREIDYSQKLIKVLTHEIMNSVTPIISLTKLIGDKLLDAESGQISAKTLSGDERNDLARSLVSVQSRSSGLLRFVQAYGTLTNLPRPNFSTVDVETLFERVHTLLAPALQVEGLVLETQTTSAPLTVRADPQQVEQVLINLVKNAAEALAGRSDGRVALRALRDEQAKVLIQVVDNGPGIAAELLDDIFVPFFTTKRSGTGVGLSVSRQIMFLNKGLLSVRTGPGRGSEFTLKFK
jgi:nitrogen fixation/metabolism regulation signal transduction histidine kinase